MSLYTLSKAVEMAGVMCIQRDESGYRLEQGDVLSLPACVKVNLGMGYAQQYPSQRFSLGFTSWSGLCRRLGLPYFLGLLQHHVHELVKALEGYRQKIAQNPEDQEGWK